MNTLGRFIETCVLMARAGEWDILLEFLDVTRAVITQPPPHTAVTAVVTLGTPEPIPGA